MSPSGRQCRRALRTSARERRAGDLAGVRPLVGRFVEGLFGAGLILLVGLIVKNGIILVDYADVISERQPNRAEALAEAGAIRLRPILMTTLCTLFGLLPLALGLGAGSELQRPLALAVIGGLALSTPITLYVVPTLLVAIRGRGYQLPRSAP